MDAVLDGTVQKSGERIRVTVRLLSAADGQQLWADKFEEEFTDIFSVEDSISERVAAALAVTLTGADKKQLTKRSTENAEAYQLYLKGRYYAGKYTPEGTRKRSRILIKRSPSIRTTRWPTMASPIATTLPTGSGRPKRTLLKAGHW